METVKPLTPAQLDVYLKRIRLQRPPDVNLTSLEAVVHAHSHAIPFENLSLTHPLAIPPSGASGISTDLPAVFDKLVLRQRGGYCFETTKLLSAALRSLGFDVYDGAARVVKGPIAPVDGHGHPIAPPVTTSSGPVDSKPDGVTPPAVPSAHQMAENCRISAKDAAGADAMSGDTSAAGSAPSASTSAPDVVTVGGTSSERSAVDERRDASVPEPPEVLLEMHGLSHMIVLVGLEDQLWLADVGFGGSAPTQPVQIDSGANVIDAAQSRRHRLRRGMPGTTRLPDEESPVDCRRAGWYLQCLTEPEEDWRDLYFFTLSEFYEPDFAAFNWKTSTHPESLFVRQMICTMPKAFGRATLLSSETGEVTLKLKRRSERPQVTQLRTEAERLAALKEHFGIVLL